MDQGEAASTARRTTATWRKSSRSNGSGECVEMAADLDGLVGLRDSKDPSGPVLMFPPARWTAFVQGLKNDNLCS
ncbi:DUF397 domain-containing protein [Micromonospora cathayae]|uniref:DUF397 domain-containing protein n=1 Tax=Micromonospora cathayae TaxID=3028804 RepID=A0ABY7ZV74_9ACTN|nr:DUF397 domain-containing protein [Micromonospora sp. HUAS 3]WDZ86962.1 DUF397 domain-containing protein [Micromonospora sp. HUAS 3]